LFLQIASNSDPEEILDSGVKVFGDAQGQVERWGIALFFKGDDGLARDAQNQRQLLLGNVFLEPVLAQRVFERFGGF